MPFFAIAGWDSIFCFPHGLVLPPPIDIALPYAGIY
jgi:hypothetical protein